MVISHLSVTLSLDPKMVNRKKSLSYHKHENAKGERVVRLHDSPCWLKEKTNETRKDNSIGPLRTVREVRVKKLIGLKFYIGLQFTFG